MSEEFEVTYGNDDGYVGGDRPYSFDIDSDDLDDEMSDKQLIALFWERIEEDFNDSHLHLHSTQESEFVAWAKEQIAIHEADRPSREE